MPAASTAIGKYRVVDRLGQGGMGTLYLATDPALERLVAIKVLRGDFEDQDLRERFAREARSISRLRHPNIVTIFEYGDHNGQPFIVMEYISGESMAEMIARRAEIPIIRKLQMMEELCSGMAYAHRAKIVHRDIKPANIMLDEESGLVKVLDFGIARDLDASFTRFTQVIGTPSYMSPEQAGGQPLDHRSDIFSIGSVFYELLSNRQAFDGQSQLEIMDKIARSEPTPLPELCRGLDPAIIAIIDRALQKNPASRYQDLEAMRADIFRVRETGRSSSDATVVIPTSRPPAATPPPSSQLEKRRASQIRIHLDAAAAALQNADFDAAIESCEQVLLLDASNASALDVIDRARAAQQQQVIDGHIKRARGHLDERSLTKAEDALAEALKLRQDPAAVALQRELQIARREQERARQRAAAAEVALERARVCLEEGAFESAIRAASEVLAYAPESEEARSLKERAQTGLEARRRIKELDKRAAETAQSAREQFARGEHGDAIAKLEAFEKPHPVIQTALRDLRRELEAIAARQRTEEAERVRQLEEAQRREAERLREEERRRQIEDEKRHKVSVMLAQARGEIDAAEYDAAHRTLAEVERLEPAAPDLPQLHERLAERRRAADEAARRQREVADALEEAAALLAAERFYEASARAEAALALDPDNSDAGDLRTRIEAAAADHRRQIDERARLEEAERRRIQDEQRGREEEEQRRREAERRKAEEAAEQQRKEALARERAAEEVRRQEAARQLEEAAERALKEEAERERIEAEQRRVEEERRRAAEAAERARLAELERLRLAEERRAREQEQRRQEEEQRQRVEEQRRIEAAAERARLAELERLRLAEERRAREQEQRRQEEEQRRLEEEQRRIEAAAKRARSEEAERRRIEKEQKRREDDRRKSEEAARQHAEVEYARAIEQQRRDAEKAAIASTAHEARTATGVTPVTSPETRRRLNYWALSGIATGAIVVAAIALGRRTEPPPRQPEPAVVAPPTATLPARPVQGSPINAPGGRPQAAIPRPSVKPSPPARTATPASGQTPTPAPTVRPPVSGPPQATAVPSEPVRPAPTPPATPPPPAPSVAPPPAAPAPAPAPATPVPDPAVVRASDESAIRGLIERYRTAYERRDAVEVARLVHLSEKAQSELAKALQSYSSFQVSIQPEAVVFRDTQNASIRFRMTQTFRGVGGRTQTSAAIGTFQLSKAAGAWTIEKAELAAAR